MEENLNSIKHILSFLKDKVEEIHTTVELSKLEVCKDASGSNGFDNLLRVPRKIEKISKEVAIVGRLEFDLTGLAKELGYKTQIELAFEETIRGDMGDTGDME